MLGKMSNVFKIISHEYRSVKTAEHATLTMIWGILFASLPHILGTSPFIEANFDRCQPLLASNDGSLTMDPVKMGRAASLARLI